MTLAEALIALVLTLVLTTTAMALVTPATRASLQQPEAMDVQQRARVAAEMIARDAAAAGIGIYAGPQAGLVALPAVLPRQVGVTGDAPEAARADAITFVSVPSTAAQTTSASVVSPASQILSVNAAPNCGGATLCGLTAGKDVLLSDAAGHFDIFRITSVAGPVASLRLHGQMQGFAYPAGSSVTEVVSRTYSLDAATRVLRQYDGDLSDQPAADHISSLTFDYYGDNGGGAAFGPIDRASLADGPWIGAGSSRYDADLLRVRMIRISVRAEASSSAFRASAPDVVVRLDVAPRAMVIR
jgi:Tfp pilus assembly protein PilW